MSSFFYPTWGFTGDRGLVDGSTNLLGTLDAVDVRLVRNSATLAVLNATGISFPATQATQVACNFGIQAANTAGVNYSVTAGSSGTGTNIAAGNVTLSTGNSRGNAVGSILFNIPNGGAASGTAVNNAATRFTFTSSASNPAGIMTFSQTGGALINTSSGTLTIQAQSGNLTLSPTGANATNIGVNSTGNINIAPANGNSTVFVSGTGTGATTIGSTSSGTITIQPTGAGAVALTGTSTGTTTVGFGMTSGTLRLSAGASGNTEIGLNSSGAVNILPAVNGAVSISAGGTGVTSLGAVGTGQVTVGSSSKTISMEGFVKKPQAASVRSERGTSAQAIAANTATDIIWNVAATNVTGSTASISLNTGTGVFTLPRAGFYKVDIHVTTNTGTNASSAMIVPVMSSGTAPTVCAIGITDSTGTSVMANGFVVNNTAVNGTIKFQITTANSLNILASSNVSPFALTQVSITEIG